MKKFFKGLSMCFGIMALITMSFVISLSINLPDDFNMTAIDENMVTSLVPVTIKITDNKNCNSCTSPRIDSEKYNAKLMFMNSVPIKNINVHMTSETTVIPGGNPFGIKLFTEGVVIVGISDVKTNDGIYNPAKLAGLKKGDVIINIDGKSVSSNDDVAQIINDSKGQEINVFIKREESEFDVKLKPLKSSNDDLYKAGIWVRDSSAGIGTMTFVNPETNTFAGLGHGICDVDTGELLPLAHGDIICARISGIKTGEKGNPGELKGSFYNNNFSIGTLDKNTISGVYGHLNEELYDGEKTVVAMKQQVKTGDANILTTVSGEDPESYSIKIKSVNYNENCLTKNMVIEITDERLLNQTGGIVQGMSGSPIIQDKKLVGAITHVFVNDPKKGYAIFAENMLNTSTSVDYSANQRAS